MFSLFVKHVLFVRRKVFGSAGSGQETSCELLYEPRLYDTIGREKLQLLDPSLILFSYRFLEAVCKQISDLIEH